jgi:hypothetical protein
LTEVINFVPFPKIPRWSKSQHMFITEKIDGTNAQIVINEDCTELKCGSRSRWITPEDDNYGFAKWAYANKEHLLNLGKGQHFGEWWGYGINRCYNLKEKRFSLFNTLRWGTEEQQAKLAEIPQVDIVPVLYAGPFEDAVIDEHLKDLEFNGSKAAPGFQNPEGVVIYMPATRSLYKKTIGSDEHKFAEAA